MATEWISRDCVVSALDMCAVLAHYDIGAGRGTSFRIHCPFHDDDRPSCSVNPGAKVFNCFACGEQGNVLDFIAGMEDLDPKAEFRAVLEMAIEIIGHNPTPQKGGRLAKNVGDQAKKPRQSGAEAETVDATEHPGQKAAPKKSRKTPKTALACEPDGSLELEPNAVLEGPAFPLKLQSRHPWLEAQLKRIDVTRSAAQEMGIGFESRSNALMAGRVCFPIHNEDGDLVAYSGRWASDANGDSSDEDGRFYSENGREQPRYRLPKRFHKQLELFNWHRVIEQFEGVETVVLVEGFWSVLRLQSQNIPCVALMGLSISDAQIRLLSGGGIGSVIVMLDGDEEGRAAAQIIVPKLASHFFTRSISLPNGSKPDDVDLEVLERVKALCAEPWLRDTGKSSIEPKVKRQQRSKAREARVKPRSPTKSAKKRIPDQAISYSLPEVSITASMNWNGIS